MVALGFLATLPGRAQTAPVQSPTVLAAVAAGAAAAKPTNDSAPIELSAFEVRAEDDSGYQAANTTSGSRLNSRLKDTPAAVSAFTPEFIADIAATNLEEMLAHATNVEIDVEDSNAGFNNPAGRGADGGDFNFRMRGSPAGASRDFVESSVPIDLYNVERAEVASGPNSILFGLGQAGGLVSLSGKKANLNRSRTALKSIHGSWSLERYEADFNRVLIPKKLSVRFGIWVKGTVCQFELYFLNFGYFLLGFWAETKLLPFFPDVIFGFFCGMHQVRFVEAVIAKLVH